MAEQHILLYEEQPQIVSMREPPLTIFMSSLPRSATVLLLNTSFLFKVFVFIGYFLLFIGFSLLF